MSASTASTNAPEKTYKAACHCGAVAFEFKSPSLQDQSFMDCNCTICTQRGYIPLLLVGEPEDGKTLKWTAGSMDKLTKYKFGRKSLSHYFCPTCGAAPLWTYIMAAWGPPEMQGKREDDNNPVASTQKGVDIPQPTPECAPTFYSKQDEPLTGRLNDCQLDKRKSKHSVSEGRMMAN